MRDGLDILLPKVGVYIIHVMKKPLQSFFERFNNNILVIILDCSLHRSVKQVFRKI